MGQMAYGVLYFGSMNKALKLLDMPPKQWEEAVTGMLTDDAHEIERDLERIAETAGSLAAYICARRGTGGAGELSHKDAVKLCQRARRQLRRALGYTLPSAGEFNF